MRSTLAAAALVLALGIPAARADEKPVELKSAPGRDIVEANCAVCHSLDYIRINSPFMGAKAWEGEVSKMINAYGAPIEPADAKAIADYLVKNYGGPS